MKADGFTVSAPPQGHSYEGAFSRSRTGGASCFSSSGRLGGVTIVGSDTAKGRKPLNHHLKPVDARHFPASC